MVQHAACPRSRAWLILQGLGTDFQSVLTDKLLARGDCVARVYYCGGDWLFRGQDEALIFDQPRDKLPDFYRQILTERTYDGIILFGDQRDIHRPIFELAGDIPVYVLEEGYLRPGYVTFERGGSNANSALPKDAATIHHLAAGVDKPTPPAPLPPPMRRRVLMDLRHVWGTFWLRKRFPHYRTHRPYTKGAEAWGWAKRLAKRPLVSRWSRRRWRALRGKSFFFLPLQLNADTQMHQHSPFNSVLEVIDRVLRSFATHAPLHYYLLVKNHPLDNGIWPYGSYIKRLAKHLGIADRVVYVDAGDAAPMVAAAQGLVLVNSTVGLSALIAGRPVKTLGTALYDMPGLTDPQDLDTFWQKPQKPDANLLADFIKIMQVGTLIEGDLFTPIGIDRATDAILDILSGRRPRLRRAAGKSIFDDHS